MMKINNKNYRVLWILFSLICCFPEISFSIEKAPFQTTTPLPPGVSSGSLLQVTLGLLVILMVIIGIAWLVRRYGRFQSSASGSLKILGGLFIGPKERIVLLQVGDTQLLVGVAPGRVQTLHVLDTPLSSMEINPSSGINTNDLKSFAERLTMAIKQKKTA